MYRTVELYTRTDKVNRYSEMTSFEHSFLGGLIKENKPEKIVEVGVSAGGTTAAISQYLKALNINAEIYSVDWSEKWYRNKKYETGFSAKETLQNWGVNTAF